MSFSIIPVYVVSLENSDRRKKFPEKNKELIYTYIDAILGKNFYEDVQEINSSKWVKNNYKRDITLGEYGCTMSHRKIYEKMINEDIDWAIILEDDVDSSINFQEQLTDLRNDLDVNSLYILGCQEGLPAFDHIVFSKKSEIKFKDIKLRKIIKSERYVYRTAAYLISNEVAKKLFEFTNGKFCLADDWNIFYKNKIFNDIYLGDFVHHPDVLEQQSTIENERPIDTKYKFLKMIGFFTPLRNVKKIVRHIVLGNIYD